MLIAKCHNCLHLPEFSYYIDLRSSILSRELDIGCDACAWHVTVWTASFHQVRFFANDRDRAGSLGTQWAFELICIYNPRNRLRSRRCRSAVDRARFKLNEATNLRLSEPLHQSYNTPSCHLLPNERPFAERYWVPALADA